MFAAFKGKCTHCGHDHDEDTATPAPAPVIIPNGNESISAEMDRMVSDYWNKLPKRTLKPAPAPVLSDDAIAAAAKAIAQRLSLCFERGAAMSMSKLTEIVSDGLASCRESIARAPAPVTVSDAPRFSARLRSAPSGAFIVSLEEDPDGILVMLCDHRRALKSARVAGNGWTKCSDKYPEKGTDCYIFRNGVTYVAVRRSNAFVNLEGGHVYYDHNCDVSHWHERIVPPPPTDKAREEMK